MESQPVQPFPERDQATVLPGPFPGLRAKNGARSLSIDENFEASGTLRPAPGPRPVPGTDPEAIIPRSRCLKLGHGVFHRPAQAMGDQIGGPHLHHRLVVVRPAADIPESLRL